DRKRTLDEENRELQAKLRAQHEAREKTPLLPYRLARERRTEIAWSGDDAPRAPFLGARTVEPSLEELRTLIDWTFFFAAWELKGSYPQILDHATYGPQARELKRDADELLDEILEAGSLQARGAYGIWRANSEGDDIVLANG